MRCASAAQVGLQDMESSMQEQGTEWLLVIMLKDGLYSVMIDSGINRVHCIIVKRLFIASVTRLTGRRARRFDFPEPVSSENERGAYFVNSIKTQASIDQTSFIPPLDYSRCLL